MLMELTTIEFIGAIIGTGVLLAVVGILIMIFVFDG